MNSKQRKKVLEADAKSIAAAEIASLLEQCDEVTLEEILAKNERIHELMNKKTLLLRKRNQDSLTGVKGRGIIAGVERQTASDKLRKTEASPVDEVLSMSARWSSKMRQHLIAGLEAQESDAVWATASIPMVASPDAKTMVKMLKSEFGMTDRSIASAIGRTNSAVGKIFRGEVAQPRTDLVQALEKLLMEKQQNAATSR